MRTTERNKGVILADEELLPAEAACPLCGDTRPRRSLLRLQQEPPVDLLACSCGCRSASRMPLPEVLDDYYSRYYSGGRGTATFDGAGRFGRHLFRVLQAKPRDCMRILDFGGGVDAVLSRSLAREFLRAGAGTVHIALVDLNASRPIQLGNIRVDCHRAVEEAGTGFDIVVASAVVEHIPNPRPVLLSLLQALNPGGGAYFRTPAVSSIASAASRFGVRIDFGFPAHLHDMGQEFWESLLPSLRLDQAFQLVRSRPSIVETEFSADPLRTVASHLFKLPWFLLGSTYTMVGGWEAVFRRS